MELIFFMFVASDTLPPDFDLSEPKLIDRPPGTLATSHDYHVSLTN